jgi:hypothetical protein
MPAILTIINAVFCIYRLCMVLTVHRYYFGFKALTQPDVGLVVDKVALDIFLRVIRFYPKSCLFHQYLYTNLSRPLSSGTGTKGTFLAAEPSDSESLPLIKAVPLHAMEALEGRGGIAPTHSRPRH